MPDSKTVGEVRASQVLTTYGPGSLIDFPRDAAIMGGVNFWPTKEEYRREIIEPRLREKLATMLQLPNLRLIAPPAAESLPWEKGPRVRAFRFPTWFLVDVDETDGDGRKDRRSRRLVDRRQLDSKLQFNDRRAVPIRFVQACVRGHISDVHWRRVVPCKDDACRRPLWLDESGSGGDLSDLTVRCGCGATISLATLADRGDSPLGMCNGWRPWLGPGHEEDCDQRSRLLIRTATNAYFSQTMSALSLPQKKDKLATAVENQWPNIGSMATARESIPFIRNFPGLATEVVGYSDDEIWAAIEQARKGGATTIPVKEAELQSILAAPTQYMSDLPPDKEFLARRLPDSEWREAGPCDLIECVVQLHRLREVTALTGFTRFEPQTPDIHGEYEGDVKVAMLDPSPRDFPAVENRGEGVFLQLRTSAVKDWTKHKGVVSRTTALAAGHSKWCEDRKHTKEFVGPEYILLHTLAHLLLQSVALTCGYPATSIRERIYVEDGKFGLLLYTATPDADGTLGGLVSEARRMAKHLNRALRDAALCSGDPTCSQHDAGKSLENRWLHGAACHSCSLIAETSCEMRNEYLDRALVVPVLGVPDAAFFSSTL